MLERREGLGVFQETFTLLQVIDQILPEFMHLKELAVACK